MKSIIFSLNFRRIAIVVVLIAAFVAAATSQTPTPTPVSKPTLDEEVIKVSSRLVVVPVAVTDSNGRSVEGLTAKDFRITEEIRPQNIESVGTADAVPLEIALLFDISATTSPMFKFQQETAAKFLQDVMRANDRASVFTIGVRSVMVAPRDTVDKAVAAVRSIVPTQELTAFYDTIGTAADYLRKNAPEGTRRVVVVISDGEDTNSAGISKAIQESYRQIGDRINTLDTKSLNQITVKARNDANLGERSRVMRSLQNADTVFYSINPAGSSFQLNSISVFGQENMQKFADETGGTAFLPKFQPIDTKDQAVNGNNERKNTEVLDRIFRQLANELRSQYLIQYYSESEYPQNRFVKLEVGVPGRIGVNIKARQGYYVKN